jgi:hypothetical protein
MRGRETAGNDLARRLVLVVLGMTFFALAALMWPSQASAQLPVCPGSTLPAPGHSTCRPICELPSFQLTTSSVGAGAGTFTATAPAPYDPAPYQTKGDTECAVPADTNTWNVKQACTFHCVHWHTFVEVVGLPQPSTARVTATATSGHFLGWTPASGCRPPTSNPDRRLCVVKVDEPKTVTANFGTDPDAQPPTAATIAVTSTGIFSVTFQLVAAATDVEWLGGYEVIANGELLTRVNPAGAETVTVSNIRCDTNYTFRLDAFDSVHATPSNEVAAKTSTCPKVAPNAVFHVKPARRTRQKSAFFHWGARRGGVDLPQHAFKSRCKVDKRRWTKCSAVNGKTVRKLKPGWHTFRVKVGDSQGWDRTPAIWRWQVRR